MNHLLSRPSVRFLLLMLSLVLALKGQTTRFVDADASGANNGTSWSDAYTDLQDALGAAVSGDEIWVAAGTYIPSSGSDRTVSFVLSDGVGLYGGFAGSETLRSQRDPAANPTILSGDLNGDDGPNFSNNGENSYHVVYAENVDASAVLDGFTIRGGNSNTNIGGGMYNYLSSHTVANCTFSGNSAQYGGGMGNYGCNPTVTNCTFFGNSAQYDGGGMYNHDSSPTVTSCTFSGNSADLGGGMDNQAYSSPTIRNCTFSGNTARSASGMENYSFSSPTISFCTFSGNSAQDASAMMFNNVNSYPTVQNSIFWDDDSNPEIAGNSSATIDTCIVRGGYAGTNIITDDPLLGPLADNGGPTPTHALLPGSPAIDAAAGSTETTDQRGVARPQGPASDIGAYEEEYHTVSFQAGPGGILSGTSYQSVVEGGSTSPVTALPAAGHAFVNWTGTGFATTTSNPLTVTHVTGDMTLTANFITLQYTLTPSAGAGGTISPDTPQTVSHGASATFTISPDAGHHIEDVLVDGISVGAVSSYTFTGVSRNHTISANFDNLPPLVTILEPAEGSTVLDRVTVRAQIYDDDGIVSSELRVNGQVVALGERIENRHDSFQPGCVQTEDFCFCASLGVLRLDADGRLRQILEDGRSVPVLSPDFELRHLQALPQKGWLLLSPVRSLRDSFGQNSSLLLIDPARGIARSLLSDGCTLLPAPELQDEPVQMHHDGSLGFAMRDELSGQGFSVRWSEGAGQILTDASVQGKPGRTLPRNRFVFLEMDFESPDGYGRHPAEMPVRTDRSGVWVYEWDSDATPAGPLTLTVRAHDVVGSFGEDSVQVKLAQVHLDLQGERRMAQAWSIQRPYGVLEISAQGEETEIASLRLLRRVNEGDFVVLTTFSTGQLSPSPLVYHDKYLQKNQSYTYRLEALDALGRTLGFSPDLTL